MLLPSLLWMELFWLWSLYLEHKNAASSDLNLLPTKQMLARNAQVLFERDQSFSESSRMSGFYPSVFVNIQKSRHCLSDWKDEHFNESEVWRNACFTKI